jgi:hypothetical protein
MAKTGAKGMSPMKTSSVYGWNRGVNALQNEAEKLSHDLGNLVKDM